MKKDFRWSLLLLSGCLFLLPFLAFNQFFFTANKLSREWAERYNAASLQSADQACATALDAWGNVLTAGTIESAENGADYAIVKRDANGRLLWREKYNGPANGADRALALAVDAAGNVYVTGTSNDYREQGDYATIKYDKNGLQQWTARFNGAGGRHDEALALAVDGRGNVYVTGRSAGEASGADYATVKYDRDGRQQWVRTYNGALGEDDEARALAVDALGNVYVTGTSEGNYATLKYTAAGDLLWEKVVNGPANGYDQATALDVDAAGNVYVTGASEGRGSASDFLTVKYDPSGRQLWTARYNGPQNGTDAALAVAADRNGNVFVTGASDESESASSMALVAYSSVGALLWTARHESDAAGDAWHQPAALAVDAAGNVYVTGRSAPSGEPENGDAATFKYDAQGACQWKVRFNGPAGRGDAGLALSVDAAGNVYMAGVSAGKGSGDDFLLVKYSAEGRRQWTGRESGMGNGAEEATALAVHPSGTVAAAGWATALTNSAGEGTTDYLTISYNADGSPKWEKRYNGPGNGNDEATAVATDEQGNVYVTGASYGSASEKDFATIKYDRNGGLQWVARYNGPSATNDIAVALAVDAAGNVYVTGSSEGNHYNRDYATIKYDRNGAQQWVARYNGAAGGMERAASLAVDAAGNVYVTGSGQLGDQASTYLTLKYNARGEQLWAARYAGRGGWSNAARDLAVDAAGNVYVTGKSYGCETGADYATVKYDYQGREVWARRFNGPLNGYDEATALAVDAAGNVWVTGKADGTTNSADYATIKYDAEGNECWVRRFNGSRNSIDGATALALDGKGNCYVTGQADGLGAGGNLASVMYDAQGNRLWSETFAGTGNGQDKAAALAVDARGNVYITGRSTGRVSGSDLLTLKYTPRSSALAGRKAPSLLQQTLFRFCFGLPAGRQE
ncbi:SBBP repeat-containing protein [Paraflavisolibacter sp. H34]|uniref:SBBP repeat-containing protein n=1 Tax=Huijunlia imazamoxiresistens TaxID=3127457 RepID=UPI003018BD97